MKTIHLMYVENQDFGTFPNEVSFYAGLMPEDACGDNIKTSLRHVMQTKDTPRKILKKLEKMAFERTGEKPDGWDGITEPLDKDPKYAEFTRHIHYLGISGLPGIAKTEEQSIELAKKYTASRNSKLLESYKMLIESVSAVPEIDS